MIHLQLDTHITPAAQCPSECAPPPQSDVKNSERALNLRYTLIYVCARALEHVCMFVCPVPAAEYPSAYAPRS